MSATVDEGKKVASRARDNRTKVVLPQSTCRPIPLSRIYESPKMQRSAKNTTVRKRDIRTVVYFDIEDLGNLLEGIVFVSQGVLSA